MAIVRIACLTGQPVGAAGDIAQFADRRFGELALVVQQPLEHRLGKRLFKFEADEFLTMPDDSAELRFQPGNTEPDPAVVLDLRRAFDAAAMGRHVDDLGTDPASGAVAHGRGQPQRSPVAAPAVRLLCGCLSHGDRYPLAALSRGQW